NEGQLRYRWPALDIFAALGFDAWNRRLSANQQENYEVLYVRLGFEHDNLQHGWLLSAGAKYPIWTQEDAHLTDVLARRYTLSRLRCTTSCDDALAHLHE